MKWESEDLSNHFKGCMENVFDKSKGRLRRSEIKLICYLFLFDTIYLFVSVPQITSTPTNFIFLLKVAIYRHRLTVF